MAHALALGRGGPFLDAFRHAALCAGGGAQGLGGGSRRRVHAVGHAAPDPVVGNRLGQDTGGEFPDRFRKCPVGLREVLQCVGDLFGPEQHGDRDLLAHEVGRELAHHRTLDVRRRVRRGGDLAREGLLIHQLRDHILRRGDFKGFGNRSAEHGAQLVAGRGASRVGRIRERGVAVRDRVLGDVDDHTVRCAEREQAVPVGADPGDRLVDQPVLDRQVGDHPHPRVDLVDHVAGAVVARVSPVRRQVVDDLGNTGRDLRNRPNIELERGHEHINTLGLLDRQFVRAAVAGPDERQAVPVEPVAGRAGHGVDPAPVPDRDTVVVVADPAVVGPVELVDVDLIAVAHGGSREGLGVPVGHRLHALDHRCGTFPRRATRRAVHPQRLPAPGPRSERVQVGQFPDRRRVQVRQEDVVDRRDRDL